MHIVIRPHHNGFWAVWDYTSDVAELVCICVYKKGAIEVQRRLYAEYLKK